MKSNFIQMNRESIVVNIPMLIGIGLNANQYMHLALLHQQIRNNLAPLTEPDFDCLVQLGYLNPNDTITELGKSLFEDSESVLDRKFKELYEAYPRQVPNGSGGYRVLRSKDVNSQDALSCKKKYVSIIKDDKNLHDQVMRGLKTELYMRKTSMTYMQNLQTWINQKSWEKYMDLDVNTDDADKVTSI